MNFMHSIGIFDAKCGWICVYVRLWNHTHRHTHTPIHWHIHSTWIHIPYQLNGKSKLAHWHHNAGLLIAMHWTDKFNNKSHFNTLMLNQKVPLSLPFSFLSFSHSVSFSQLIWKSKQSHNEIHHIFANRFESIKNFNHFNDNRNDFRAFIKENSINYWHFKWIHF